MNPQIDLDDESLSEAELARRDALAARVEAFGSSLIKKREEAIAARTNSGIEDEWRAAEEAYQGIDDANRDSLVRGKPSGPNGGYVNGPVKSSTRSTVLLNITRPYVDAAAARVGDMLLPTDDTPWSLKTTPIVSVGQIPKREQPQEPTMAPGQELLPPLQPGQPAPPPVDPALPGGQPPGMTGQPQLNPLAQAMKDAEDEAKVKAEGATKQIEDWHIECQWHAEVRKMIEDCARLGTGILKGPFPVKRTSRKTAVEGGLMGFVMTSEIKPASKAISPWKFFPDGGCGEDIHDGSGCWEADTISAKALRDLKGMPGYIDSQIDKAVALGPQGKNRVKGFDYGKVTVSDVDNFDIWYYYGIADREDLEAAGVELPETGDTTVPCVVTIVNDIVIKANLTPLDSGEFPFDVMPWTRKTGMPWGSGVAMQINTPQRMLTAGVRNMMDNAGLSAGPQIVIRKGAITPASGGMELTPRKIWYANEGADVNTVQQAFMIVNIPTMQKELEAIIQFALKMAEDVTGLPMLMQGQASQSTPDTVGGMQMINNNASVVLRRIARMFDDKVTEPHIRRYYDWLMTYGDDDSIKGDFQIDARGSTALVERDIQNQAILAMGALATNPAFGVDPEKWFVESLKAQRLDPKRFLMDEDKKAQMAQQPPPKAPVVEAAEIRTQAELQKAELAAQTKDKEIAARVEIANTQALSEYDRDTAYVQAENQRTEMDHQARREELALKRELAMLEYANNQKITLDKVKADLAGKAMEINATKELVGLNAKASQLPTPPVEPPGTAPAGQSFQR